MKKFALLALAAALSVSMISALAAKVDPMHDNFDLNSELVNVRLAHVGAGCDDVTETGMKLKIYDEICYRPSDIESLQPGDIINCEEAYTVQTVKRDDEGSCEINGGYAGGGLSLRHSGGAYVPYRADDIGYLDMMREETLPFAEQVTVNRHRSGADGGAADDGSEQTVAAAEVKALLFGGEDGALSPTVTGVTVENGRITRVEIGKEV